MTFYLSSNFHFADILPSPELKLEDLQGTVLSEIFFNVLISFFGRSPGSRYMRNHRMSCCKYVSSELMRSKKGQTNPFLFKSCFPRQLSPRQLLSFPLTPSGFPDCSQAGGDEAWHTILPPHKWKYILPLVPHELTSVSCFINFLNYSIFRGCLLKHSARPSWRHVCSCSSSRSVTAPSAMVFW